MNNRREFSPVCLQEQASAFHTEPLCSPSTEPVHYDTDTKHDRETFIQHHIYNNTHILNILYMIEYQLTFQTETLI